MTLPTLPAASLDRRFYAYALDRLVAWPLLVLAAWLGWRLASDGSWLPGLVLVLGVALLVTVVLGLLVGLQGSTPGKTVVGLRVVGAESGEPLGAGPGVLRTLVLALAGLPALGLGVATLAQTAVLDPGRRRRGWHDHLTGAVVVDVRPAAERTPDAVAPVAPQQVVNLTAMRLAPAAARPAPTQAPTPTPTPTPAPARRAAPAPSEPATVPVPSAGSDLERTQVRGLPAVGRHAAPPAPVGWQVAFDSGEQLVVDGVALLGRRPEGRPGEAVHHLVPLRSEDMSVSKTHAQLHVSGDGSLVVTDRGSTNGSALVRSGVARQLPPGKPTTLLDGDVVRFGDRSMTVSRQS
ncbi:hypothetical protein GCM10009623_11410 [Nocardioides aestuarii]|uniref:RDD family protein n=1 Tax=Nocardioides aestuarii TaxID=252231 RepID=A0ABW4TIR8_9ACTN